MSKKVKFVAFSIYLLLLFMIVEVSIRVMYPNRFILVDEKNSLYHFDENLGWFPKKNQTFDYERSQKINVNNNNLGFRDHTHLTKTKPRILFIGDSFTWGYDVELDERFTNLLQNRLPDWEILNTGVSGYGTDQSFILLQEHFDFYQPDIVFYTFCSANDRWENSIPVVYDGYFKPYFLLNKEHELVLAGQPVKKSFRYLMAKVPLLSKSRFLFLVGRTIHRINKPPPLKEDPTEAILFAMKNYIETKGAKLMIGFTEDNIDAEEVKWCENNNVPFVLLENSHVYPAYGRHWTPKGHQFVEKKIFSFFKEKNVIE